MEKSPPAVAVHFGLEVVFRVTAFVAGGAVADFQNEHVYPGAIDDLVGAPVGREPGAHAGLELNVFGFRHQGRRALDDIDKLLLHRMAMQERAFAARLQSRQVDAKLGEAEQVSKLALFAL